jgi:hypothetical protein
MYFSEKCTSKLTPLQHTDHHPTSGMADQEKKDKTAPSVDLSIFDDRLKTIFKDTGIELLSVCSAKTIEDDMVALTVSCNYRTHRFGKAMRFTTKELSEDKDAVLQRLDRIALCFFRSREWSDLRASGIKSPLILQRLTELEGMAKPVQ